MVRERVLGIENVTISVHCHNDLGLAVANTIAAINAGARQVECTINGIGERAGNASLEEIAMVLNVRRRSYRIRPASRRRRFIQPAAARARSSALRRNRTRQSSARNAFAHEAGIHQHGMIANPLCYEIMTPESVGVEGNNLVLGKHSGRHALSKRWPNWAARLLVPSLIPFTHAL